MVKLANQVSNKIDEIFDLLQELKMPNNIYLAIGCLLSFSKTKNKLDLARAISYLNKEMERL